VNHELLEAIYRGMPEYRDRYGLLDGAARINPGIGSFRPAWILGTKPLILAYTEEHPDLDDPGSFRFYEAWDKSAHGDFRRRDAALIQSKDLSQSVNAVLIYPEAADPTKSGFGVAYLPRDLQLPARLLFFRDSRTLAQLLQTLGEPDGNENLTKSAARVVEINVNAS
jgi:hypothetical protein